MIAGTVLTSGEFLTEGSAWDTFDWFVEKSQAFRLLKEVPGFYVQPRPGTEVKGARIDRVLIPLQKAIDAGWVHGAIGVEGKKSGHKMGPLIVQAMDYSRCVFELERPPGLLVMMQWVFIYPGEIMVGELMSIVANSRIGTCSISNSRLIFGCSGYHGLVIDSSGAVTAKALPMGNKRGSR